ncbi:MAG: NAD(P)H-hydrate dehydratase [Lachnospiraceae bacterium]|nr:NAD(P)H-hydrate dehydratase [Lachnospiraceae bacterium]
MALNEGYITLDDEKIDMLMPIRTGRNHKGSFGKVLVIAGSDEISGAAYLAALGAYKIGAGLVKVYTHTNNSYVIRTLLPEALVSLYGKDTKVDEVYETAFKEVRPDDKDAAPFTKDSTSDIDEKSYINDAIYSEGINQKDIEKFYENVNWADVIVCGPGIGTNEFARFMVTYLCTKVDKYIILDADAINCLAMLGKNNKVSLTHGENAVFNNEKLILTPHLKEYERLLNSFASKSVADSDGHYKNEEFSVRDITEDMGFCSFLLCGGRFSGVLVLKDSHTLVRQKNKMYINNTGNSALSKGGSGDVLAGIIGGLMGQYVAGKSNISAFEAVAVGVYIHGRAADRYILEKPGYTMLARDIVNYL